MKHHFAGDDPFADTKVGNALTRAIVDAIADPFLVLDADLRIVAASRSFYEKFQVDQKDTQGQLFYKIGNGQYNIPALLHFLRNIIPDHAVMKEFKVVHDFVTIGSRTMLLSAREVVYENSKYKYLLLTMGDITGQEILEREKERLHQEKSLLLKEMKHRMANSLQLIASILILKAETAESLEVRSHLKDAHSRIMSIATVERLLDTTSMTEEVEVGPYLTGLCKSLSDSMIGAARPVKIVVESHGGMIPSREAISLGLITAELVINAIKYDFPLEKAGTISVMFQLHDGKWELSISDDGVGIVRDVTRKEGLGTTIVQSLARQLNAEVDVRTSPQGTSVTIKQLS